MQVLTHVAQAGQTHESQRGRGCPVCGDEHKVTKCSVFGNMSLAERKLFIRDKNMYFGCLTCGHHSKDYKIRHTCSVCSKKHPTLLHDYSSQSHVPQFQTCTAPTPENVSLATETMPDIKTSNRVTTMILPVILRHPSNETEFLVYALLDTQSNTNFVTDEVVKMLNVSGRSTSLNVTTMNGC